MIPFKERMRDFDKTLFLVTIAIFAVGLVFLLSATSIRGQDLNFSYVSKQISSAVLALILLVVIININYQRFLDAAWVLYALSVLALALLLVIGRARFGAQRWFAIGSFTIQPSEFLKIAFVLTLSAYISGKKWMMENAKNLVIPFLVCAVPFLLVILQPDLGTGLLLVPALLAMLYVGGANAKHLLTVTACGILFSPVFWQFLKDYQRQRLLVFMNPSIDPLGAGYTIIQSKIAVGSGGLFGKGWLAGTQNQLNFLPERHTDFIFSVVGEEWGFFGSAILLVLYFILIKRIFRIARLTSDLSGKLIATGIGTLFAFQVIINIGMTIGLMPVVGIPLILVSYGGSSLVATSIAVALVLNVGMRRSTF